MLTTRVIPCLDVEDGRVVKGTKFKQIRDAGDPVELARAYNDQGADEIIFLDIGATYRSQKTMVDVVEKVSRCVFVPLTVGGGIRSIDDMRLLLTAGADKVSVCSAALSDPTLLSRGAEIFGSQCIVLSVDAKRTGHSWNCYVKGGREDTGIDALEWAVEGARLGAGEILLNSIDKDGTQSGYDLELTRRVIDRVNIPVIASGGAGNLDQVVEAVLVGKADAVLLASLLHYGTYTVPDIKKYMEEKGVHVR
jgi:cyclase